MATTVDSRGSVLMAIKYICDIEGCACEQDAVAPVKIQLREQGKSCLSPYFFEKHLCANHAEQFMYWWKEASDEST